MWGENKENDKQRDTIENSFEEIGQDYQLNSDLKRAHYAIKDLKQILQSQNSDYNSRPVSPEKQMQGGLFQSQNQQQMNMAQNLHNVQSYQQQQQQYLNGYINVNQSQQAYQSGVKQLQQEIGVVQQLEQQKQKYKDKYKKQRREFQILDEEYQKQKQVNQELKKELKITYEQNENFVNQLNQFQGEMLDLYNQNEHFQKQIKDLKSLEHLNEKLREQLKEQNDGVDKLLGEIQDQNVQLENQKSEKNLQDYLFQELNQKFKLEVRQNEDLKNEVQEQFVFIKEIQQENDELKKQNLAWKRNTEIEQQEIIENLLKVQVFAEKRIQLDSRQNNFDQIISIINFVKQNFDSKVQQIQLSQEKIIRLQEENANLSNLNVELDSICKELENNLEQTKLNFEQSHNSFLESIKEKDELIIKLQNGIDEIANNCDLLQQQLLENNTIDYQNLLQRQIAYIGVLHQKISQLTHIKFILQPFQQVYFEILNKAIFNQNLANQEISRWLQKSKKLDVDLQSMLQEPEKIIYGINSTQNLMNFTDNQQIQIPKQLNKVILYKEQKFQLQIKESNEQIGVFQKRMKKILEQIVISEEEKQNLINQLEEFKKTVVVINDKQNQLENENEDLRLQNKLLSRKLKLSINQY